VALPLRVAPPLQMGTWSQRVLVPSLAAPLVLVEVRALALRDLALRMMLPRAWVPAPWLVALALVALARASQPILLVPPPMQEMPPLLSNRGAGDGMGEG